MHKWMVATWLGLLLLAGTVIDAAADGKTGGGKTPALTEEEKEIVEMVELLEMMELLRDMELLADYDIIGKEKKDEAND